MMPMATQVGCLARNSNGVAHANRNILLASGAQIHLEGGVWLDAARLDFAVQVFPNVACHDELPEKRPADKHQCNTDCHGYKPDIALACHLFACRIKTHGSVLLGRRHFVRTPGG